METDGGWDIQGLDAYPELKVRRRFPTKHHIMVKCPRYGETVDVVFTRIGRPLCLSVLDKDECDCCWAYNLLQKKEIPDSHKPKILEEINYWKSLGAKYGKARVIKILLCT